MLQILLVFWFPGLWRVLDLAAGLRVWSPGLRRVLDLPAGRRVWFPGLWRVLDLPAGLRVWSPGLWRVPDLPAGLRVWSPGLWRVLDHPAGLKVRSHGFWRASSLTEWAKIKLIKSEDLNVCNHFSTCWSLSLLLWNQLKYGWKRRRSLCCHLHCHHPPLSSAAPPALSCNHGDRFKNHQHQVKNMQETWYTGRSKLTRD